MGADRVHFSTAFKDDSHAKFRCLRHILYAGLADRYDDPACLWRLIA